MMEEDCRLCCYDFKRADHNVQVHFATSFDGKNNNWILMDGYLALPFSYMTFVIIEKT